MLVTSCTPSQMFQHFTILVSRLLCVLFLATLTATAAVAENDAPVERIITLDHQPATAARTRTWIPVKVGIETGEKIKEVRLYFKTMKSDWYVFVAMEQDKSIYSAQIPPAKNGTRGLDYFLIIILEEGQVLQTKDYRVLVQDTYDSVPPGAELSVRTEVASPPSFRDDFAIPLAVAATQVPVLAQVEKYRHDPIDIPGPASGRGPTTFFGGVGSAAISITAGSVGIRYKTSSGF